jgi:hypothetical protein
MRPILAILILAVATGAFAQEDPDEDKGSALYRALGWGVYVSQAGDLLVTEHRLSQGGVFETNPMMQRRGARAAATIAGPFAVNWASEKARKEGHPNFALWIRIAFIAGNGYLIAHNLRLEASR